MRIAIIGTGFIAREMIEAIQAYGEEFEVVTVYNRTLEKAEQFAKDYQIAHVSRSYEEALTQAIDGVYLAVHSNDHYSMTKQAIQAGKHVLCEKPAVLNQREFDELANLARTEQVIWMDAMRFIHLPLWKEIKHSIHNEEIGEIVYVEGSLGRISQRLYRHTRELAGGVLYDLAIYPLYAIIDLLGKPVVIQSQGVLLESGVDHTVSIQLQYRHALAHVMASCVSQTQTHLRIQGTKATIFVPKEFTTSPFFEILYPDGTKVQREVECLGSGMIYELRSFASGETQQNLSKDVYEILTLSRTQLGIHYPSELV
ncbi:MAG: Gfo/Idh/MocA family protein [Culicoidibacterales bacterium]